MRDFDPSESMENVGILDVFPIFILHDWGKRSAEARSSHLSGVALGKSIITPSFASTKSPKIRSLNCNFWRFFLLI